MDDEENFTNTRKSSVTDESKKMFHEKEDDFEYLTFTEVKNTIDLLDLYIDINNQVTKEKKMPATFKRFLANMKSIRDQLNKIRLENIPIKVGKEDMNIRNTGAFAGDESIGAYFKMFNQKQQAMPN